MKGRLSWLGLTGLALLLLLAGPVLAEQTFSNDDLEGDWDVYTYGAYEGFTESAYGMFHLNHLGQLTSGGVTYRGTYNAFLPCQINLHPGGLVTGNLKCELVDWMIYQGRMNQRKSEITLYVQGQRSPVLMRLVKASGEPAPAEPSEDGEEEDGEEGKGPVRLFKGD
ncbi:MAG: hypothetical protein JRJ59_06420 [Deltaproteobacteria bacterium]|nr:hypothetical protein [Deltaproteobacteria bacterium]